MWTEEGLKPVHQSDAWISSRFDICTSPTLANLRPEYLPDFTTVTYSSITLIDRLYLLYRMGFLYGRMGTLKPSSTHTASHTRSPLLQLDWVMTGCDNNSCTPPCLCWRICSNGMLKSCHAWIHMAGGDHFKSRRPPSLTGTRPVWPMRFKSSTVSLWSK